jgi:hypothetical protein
MRMMLALAAVALCLGGCANGPGLPSAETAATVGGVIDATGAKAPAPLASTSIDEKAVVLAFEAADTVATQVDTLVATGLLVKGSPKALAVKSALGRLRSFLTSASAAQKAGNATTYRQALSDAATAMHDAATALRGQ